MWPRSRSWATAAKIPSSVYQRGSNSDGTRSATSAAAGSAKAAARTSEPARVEAGRVTTASIVASVGRDARCRAGARARALRRATRGSDESGSGGRRRACNGGRPDPVSRSEQPTGRPPHTESPPHGYAAQRLFDAVPLVHPARGLRGHGALALRARVRGRRQLVAGPE